MAYDPFDVEIRKGDWRLGQPMSLKIVLCLASCFQQLTRLDKVSGLCTSEEHGLRDFIKGVL